MAFTLHRSLPKYDERFDSVLMYKRSLYIRPELVCSPVSNGQRAKARATANKSSSIHHTSINSTAVAFGWTLKPFPNRILVLETNQSTLKYNYFVSETGLRFEKGLYSGV